MQFFLQLDLASLPQQFQAALAGGILQLFYCSTDDGSCETWEPFSGAHQIAIMTASLGGVPRPRKVRPFNKSAIVGWQKFMDAPHPEEHKSLGITYQYDFPNNVVSVSCADPEMEFRNLDIGLDVEELISDAESGDKLGGWPYWVQGAEYPSCPQCGEKMNLLFQIDSEDHLPYMFGDAGCGHLTQCPNHPETLAFGWACG